MWTAPPEGVPYEQWLMDQVAMRTFVALLLEPPVAPRDEYMTVNEATECAWDYAEIFVRGRQLIDQGVNKAD